LTGVTGGWAQTSSIKVGANGKVGIGVDPNDTSAFPGAVLLNVKGSYPGDAVVKVQNTSPSGFSGMEFRDSSGNARFFFGVSNSSSPQPIHTRLNSFNGTPFVFMTNTVEAMRIRADGAQNGFVGIGTSSPTERLHVNGNIRVTNGSFISNATALNVPDFVFEPDYELMPLDDLAAFVAREKHLPNVPSASEIKADGLNLGELQMRLLEKVEELTLYALKQNEELEQVKQESARLRESQERRIAELEAALRQFSTAAGNENR